MLLFKTAFNDCRYRINEVENSKELIDYYESLPNNDLATYIYSKS